MQGCYWCASTEDCQVTAQSSGDTDYGSLVITETRQPLTGLFKLLAVTLLTPIQERLLVANNQDLQGQ